MITRPFAVSMLFLVACSDQSLWTAEGTPSGAATDPVFQDDDSESWEEDTGDWGDTGEGADDGPWMGQWGEVVFAGAAVEEGITGFTDWDGASVQCEVYYELTAGAPDASCSACSLAGTFTLGAATIEVDVDGRCGELGWADLQGESLTVGHADPETLWARDEGSWEAVGWSSMTGTLWEFEIEFDVGDASLSAKQPDGRGLRDLPDRAGPHRRERPTLGGR